MQDRLTSGGSGAWLVEQHFSNLIRRFNIAIENGGILAAELCQLPSFGVLTIRYNQDPARLLEAVAIQMGFLELGYLTGDACWFDGRQPGEVRSWREWRNAVKWAARYLVPDAVMEEAERQGWNGEQIAYECGVTVFLADVRFWMWSKGRRDDVQCPFFGYRFSK